MIIVRSMIIFLYDAMNLSILWAMRDSSFGLCDLCATRYGDFRHSDDRNDSVNLSGEC